MGSDRSLRDLPGSRLKFRGTVIAPALAMLALAAFDAHADSDVRPQSLSKTGVDVLAPARTTLFAARRAGDTVLASQRGGTDVSSDSTLRGVVSDNQAVNVTTGGNVIAGGALAGASGIPVVIQNSGNNVLIQSSTIVNVQIK